MILPKRTIIRIGQNKDKTVRDEAVGVEFQLLEDTDWGETAIFCPILKNPNGWSQDMISHRLNSECDVVVYTPLSDSNEKAVSFVLKKE